MKFRTFKTLLVLGGLGAATGAAVLAYSACDTGKGAASSATATSTGAAPTQAKDPVKPSPASTATTPAAQSPGDPSALRPMDRKILDRVALGITGDKVKDAIKGESYKVNLYNDPDGKRRAKIDLDRDEKWDEKWTFETDGGNEKVKRQVSTQDDDSYDVEYRLDQGTWVKK